MQSVWIGSVLVVVSGVGAQGALRTGTVAADEFRVPVHAAVDGAGGLWTAGADYKAQFAEGSFTFYPWLGKEYAGNRPWTWKTVSVAAGDQRLAHRPLETEHGDWHVAFRGAAVTERYDVRPEGVEQSFVIHERPAAPGDLCIIGCVTTSLVGDRPPAAVQQELCFRDATGVALVHYGEAWAIDAAGRRVPVATGFDGETVSLSVDGAWLRGASFPVVVDPLTTRQLRERQFAGFGEIGALDLTGDNGDEAVIYTRQFSATDHDVYARLVSFDGSTSTTVFTSLHPALDVRSVAGCYVSKTGDYVYALTHFDASLGLETLLVYFHDHQSLVLNGGTVRTLASPARHYRNVDLGGAREHDETSNALLVYELATVGQSNTEVFGRLLFTASRQIALTTTLLADAAAGANLDRRNPTVQEHVNRPAYWVTAFEERDIRTPDDRDIYGAQISDAGARGVTALLQDGSENGAGNALRPRIDGVDERLLLTYLHSDSVGSTTGKRLYTRRVTWPLGGAATLGAHRLVDSVGGLSSLQDPRLAVDNRTGSHWGLVYIRSTLTLSSLRVVRLGYSGGVTESASVFGSNTVHPIAPGIVFTQSRDRFELAWGSSDAAGSERYGLYSQGLAYPPEATAVAYGVDCSNAFIRHGSRPVAGTRLFNLSLNNAAANQPATLMLSFAAASISLGSIGMGTCRLSVDTSGGAFISSLNATTDAQGYVARGFNLPDVPLFIGDFHAQWLFLDPGANPLGMTTTSALKVQVR